MMRELTWPPAIGISGQSGTGKTLLIERLVPRLMRRGLRVAVVKQCTHCIEVDRTGKDSDRIFQAGADVLAAGPAEAFARFHESSMPPPRAIGRLTGACDLCLVEGYRGQSLPRIQVVGEGVEQPDSDVDNVLLAVTDARAQTEEAERAVWQVLEQSFRALPVMALVLIGGRSRRMEQPKAMLEWGGVSLLERVVSAASPHADRVLLGGAGVVPDPLAGMERLPDVCGVEGPLASVLSALRWRPVARWLVLACDLALIEPAAVQWLLSQTRIGIDAVFPRTSAESACEPLFAVYEPACRESLENAATGGVMALKDALGGARVLMPVVPDTLSHAWTNINTPIEWDAVRRRLDGHPLS